MSPVSRPRNARNARNARTRIVSSVVASLIGATLLSANFSNAQAAVRPSVGVPAYFWTVTDWDTVVAAPTVSYVILNPESGPGTQKWDQFAMSVTAAKASGKTVLGYVSTNYGNRAIADVKADIDTYRLWYGINTFFFDESPYDCTNIAYYAELRTYVNAQANPFTFINPGVNPLECFTDVADGIVNFEGSEAQYANWSPAAYVASHPTTKFWHIVYDADPTHGSDLVNTAADRNAAVVYLTDDTLPNPWDRLPAVALWSAQIEVPTPTTTTVAPVVTTTVVPVVTTTVAPVVTSTVAPSTTVVPVVTSTVAPSTTVAPVVTTTVAPVLTTTVAPVVSSTVTPTTTVAPVVTSTVAPTTTVAPVVTTTVAPVVTSTVAPTTTVAPSTTVVPVVTSTVAPVTVAPVPASTATPVVIQQTQAPVPAPTTVTPQENPAENFFQSLIPNLYADRSEAPTVAPTASTVANAPSAPSAPKQAALPATSVKPAALALVDQSVVGANSVKQTKVAKAPAKQVKTAKVTKAVVKTKAKKSTPTPVSKAKK
jgi:Spherulation-specific family 4